MFFYSKFKLKKWEKYSPAKRQRILQKLENKNAYWQSRAPLPINIVFDEDWYCLGMYEMVNGNACLKLNIILITNPRMRFHAMETVYHEGRHAYQYHLVEDGNPGFFNFKGKKYYKNWKGYISSKEDNVDYGMQAIERDAQIFTIKKLKRHSFRYRNEKDFTTTLNSLINRYEKAEIDAKEKYGIFYKYKINKKIRKKASKK